MPLYMVTTKRKNQIIQVTYNLLMNITFYLGILGTLGIFEVQDTFNSITHFQSFLFVIYILNLLYTKRFVS